MESHLIELLQNRILPDVCKPEGFKAIDPPADRHGSWELTLHKRSSDLDRFVSVALTSLPAAPSAPLYEVEVWAGAEKGDRYMRNLVTDFRASGLKERSEALGSALREPLRRAMTLAESFKPSNLTEAYLLPRTQR